MKILIVLLVLMSSISYAKEFDFSITPSAGYGQASWDSGKYIQPGGKLHDSSPIFNLSTQVVWRWNLSKLYPTVELDYRWADYNFDTRQAPIQRSKPRAWSILAGLTYDLGKNWSIYGLVGYTDYHNNVSFTEAYPIYDFYPKNIAHFLRENGGFHGKNIEFGENLFSYKIGIYKLWPVWIFKIGPELSIQGWNKRPGWSKCRTEKELPFQINFGPTIRF